MKDPRLYICHRERGEVGGWKDPVMKKALSPEEALAEVSSYTGLLLSADDIRSLHRILTKPRKDSAIRSHLKAENHPLGHLPHQPEGENWWGQGPRRHGGGRPVHRRTAWHQ